MSNDPIVYRINRIGPITDTCGTPNYDEDDVRKASIIQNLLRSAT